MKRTHEEDGGRDPRVWHGGHRPPEVVDVYTFNSHLLTPRYIDRTPWDLLLNIRFEFLDYIRQYFIKRDEIIHYILEQKTIDRMESFPDVAYIERILERHQIQYAWGNLIMPILCADMGACWLDSYGHCGVMRGGPMERKELNAPRITALADYNVFASSLVHSMHFYGCIIVLPKRLDHGYVLVTDPLNHHPPPSEIVENFTHGALKILELKRTHAGKAREHGGGSPEKRIKVVFVKHPEYLKQSLDEHTGDLACCFWTIMQLTYWLTRFGGTEGRDADKFIEYLDGMFSQHSGRYDFDSVNTTMKEVDRDISMESVRFHCLLMTQYIAQLDDLRAIGNACTPPVSLKEFLGQGAVKCFGALMNPRTNEVYPNYIPAGSMSAVQHYKELKARCLEIKDNHSKLKEFLDRLPSIDLIRICISNMEERSEVESYKYRNWSLVYDPMRITPLLSRPKNAKHICDYHTIFDNAQEQLHRRPAKSASVSLDEDRRSASASSAQGQEPTLVELDQDSQ